MSGNGAAFQFDPELFKPLIEQAVEAAMIRLATVGSKRGVLDINPSSASSPLALRPREAARALGVSARLLWQLTKGLSHASASAAASGKRYFTLSRNCKPG